MRLVKIGKHYVNPEAVVAVFPDGGDVQVRLGDGALFFKVPDMTVEAVLSALKRGPTPCETCRWFRRVDHKGDGQGLCNANGASQIWPNTVQSLGCLVSADAQAIGCPKHEERT